MYINYLFGYNLILIWLLFRIKSNTVKDEYDIGMYSRLRSFCSLYGWRPRNSGYTAEFQLWSMSVPHPRLPSHLHLQSPPDQNPVENELPKLEIGLAWLIFKWIIRAWLIRFRVSATRFPPDSGQAGIGGGDERGDEGGGRTWITAGIPLYIQNSVASSRIRSKNSVNGCICQYHIHL